MTPEETENFVENMSDKRWRMNHLYKIIDKEGQEVTFKMNWVQEKIFDNRHKRNVCLKSRQHGVTTFWLIFMLDECLFRENINTAVISHRLDDSKKFMEKIWLAFKNLPHEVKVNSPKKETKNAHELKFDNGSTITSTTTVRSGTTHILHVSEFGPMSFYNPDRAKEVMSGALPSVPSGGIVSFESTAKGTIGAFYQLWKLALPNDKDANGDYPPIPRRSYRPFFFAWWQDENNRVSESEVALTKIYPSDEKYFAKIKRETGLEFDARQKAWYVIEKRVPSCDIRAEHPTTPEEAWAASTEGLFYAVQMAEARELGRICPVPHRPGYPVGSAWDFGVSDRTSIIFTQTIGRAIHIIDFYENSDRGLQYYVNYLHGLSKPAREGGKGYAYGRHVIPHDGNQRQIGSDARTIADILEGYGLFCEVAPRTGLMEGIEATRSMLGSCFFDEGKEVGELIEHIESYRKQLDEKNSTDADNPVFKDAPVHDIHSHACDALRTLAMMHEFPAAGSGKPITIDTWSEEIC